MKTKNIEFQDVCVGQYVCMPNWYISQFARVTEVLRRGEDVQVKVGVTADPTMDTRTVLHGHAREGIAVRYEERIPK